MKQRPRRKRAAQAHDLALAFLGGHDATTVRVQGVIDRHTARVLDAADGNVSLTADLLGMHRRSLQRYVRRKRPRRHTKRR
jgi:ActR/RegA family two-component response regulator